jgi:2'-5' RNA ligase
MRLFTALDPPEPVRHQLAALQAPGDLDARWTDPEQFHVTVRFIGDAAPDEAARFDEALADVEATIVECRPYGLDVLPSRRNPSVLIVGLERSDDLMTLYEAVSEALEGEGLNPEDRTYRPHVTLARLNSVPAETVHDFLDTHDADALDPFHVDTLILYESTLSQEGAVHNPRANYPLGRPNA